ncbi:MAG: T9SS type A sorting domain-containing protein [Syntrophothermus sp.]
MSNKTINIYILLLILIYQVPLICQVETAHPQPIAKKIQVYNVINRLSAYLKTGNYESINSLIYPSQPSNDLKDTITNKSDNSEQLNYIDNNYEDTDFHIESNYEATDFHIDNIRETNSSTIAECKFIFYSSTRFEEYKATLELKNKDNQYYFSNSINNKRIFKKLKEYKFYSEPTDNNKVQEFASVINMRPEQFKYINPTLIPVRFSSSPTIWEINSSLSTSYLNNQLFAPGAEIDMDIYWYGSNWPEDVAAFALDPVWGRIVFGKKSNNEIKSYGDNLGDYKFSRPLGITVDENGNIYIVDTGHKKIVKLRYSPSSNAFTDVSTINVPNLINPKDILFTRAGGVQRLWILDKDLLLTDLSGNILNRINKYKYKGVTYNLGNLSRIVNLKDIPQIAFIDANSKIAGSGQIDPNDPSSLNLFGRTEFPSSSILTDIGSNPTSEFYVTDSYYNLIHKLDSFGNYVCSYSNSLINPQRFPCVNSNKPDWIIFDLFEVDAWTDTKGIKSYLQGSDAFDLGYSKVIYGDEEYLFYYTLSDFSNVNVQLLLNNAVVKTFSFAENSAGKHIIFTPSSELIPGTTYTLRVSYKPAWDDSYNSAYRQGWKYKDLIFTTDNIIRGRAFWTGPFNINSTVTVQDGAQLDINPGAVINFGNNASLIVNGTLNASGCVLNFYNKTGTLTFDGASSSNSLIDGIRINTSSQVEFKNGANVIIQNSTFENCNNGIYIYNSAPVIKNNTIRDPYGNGIYGEANGKSPLIQGNTIQKINNNLHNYQGIYLLNSTNPFITGNDINGFCYGIYYGGGGSGYCTDATYNTPAKNNRLMNNYYGITAAWGSYLTAGVPTYPYRGGVNSFIANTYDCFAYQNGTVLAFRNYWGIDGAQVATNSGGMISSTLPLYSDPWGTVLLSKASSGTTKSAYQNSNSIASSSVTSDTSLSDIYIGMRLEEKGKTDEAINHYRSMIAKDIESGFAVSSLARLYYSLKRDDLRDYFKDLKNNKSIKSKTSLIVSTFLAGMYLNQNEYDKANEIYDEIINLFNQNDYYAVNARFEKLFAALHYKKDFSLANDMLDEIKSVKSDDTDYLIRLATAEYLLTGSIQNFPKKGLRNESGRINHAALFNNYPNPFNPSTTISYQIPSFGRVTLKVYDILGREVASLVDEYKSEGKYSVQFNASNLPSGIYVYELKSNNFVSSKKLLLVK